MFKSTYHVLRPPTDLFQDKQSSLEKAFNDLASSVDNSPQLSTALSVFATALPSTYVNAITSNPASFYDNLATATTLPTEINNALNAIPTGAATYIESAYSKAGDIIASELDLVASSVAADPKYTSAVNAIVSAVPSSVQSLLVSNSAYALSIATATSLPSWTSAIPTSAVKYFSSVGDDVVSILSADVLGFSTPYATGTASSGFAKATSGGFAKPSGTANTTVTTFKGAASSLSAGGIGAGALFAAIAMWFHV